MSIAFWWEGWVPATLSAPCFSNFQLPRGNLDGWVWRSGGLHFCQTGTVYYLPSTYFPVRLWVMCSYQERCTQDWCSLSVVSAKAIRNQIVRMNWGDETDTKQPWLLYKHGLSACSATCECQTKQLPRSLLLGELEATTWTSSYYVDEDLKFNKLSLNESIDVAQNLHSGDWCLRLVLRTPSGVYQKKKKKEADIAHLFAVICIIFKNATSRHHCCCVKYSPLHIPQSFWSAATLNLAVLTVCILCHNKLLNLL